MSLLQRRRLRPRAKTIRPAERYLLAGTDQARRLGHNYVGTEHVLSVLVRDPDGAATRLLAELGVTTDAVERALACWLGESTAAATIDPSALAALEQAHRGLRRGRRSPLPYFWCTACFETPSSSAICCQLQPSSRARHTCNSSTASRSARNEATPRNPTSGSSLAVCATISAGSTIGVKIT